jgi:hypothetical protein
MSSIREYMESLSNGKPVNDFQHDRVINKMLRTRLYRDEYRRRYAGDVHGMVERCVEEFGTDRLYKKMQDMGLVPEIPRDRPEENNK